MATTSASAERVFELGQARKMVADLFTPNPAIYWCDFLGSLTIGYTAAGIYLTPDLASWWVRVICYFIAGFALYRVGIYMHEIVHFGNRQMRTFRVTWNLLAGIPMLTPSYFYESHIAHHNTHYYGTQDDGEYLPLGGSPSYKLFVFLSQIVLQPLFVVVRFTILTPISFLHPKLRLWVLEHASSFVINFRHRREVPDDAPRFAWACIDWACCARAWLIFILIIIGQSHWTRMFMLYGIAAFVLGMNHVRTLAAHRYMSDGERMSHRDQFFDSTNISGNWFTELMCPLGLRYHALHHLFPSMPYHNLGRAHRRLMAQLPEDSPYREVLYPSFWSVIGELTKSMKLAKKNDYANSRSWHANKRGEAASTAPEELSS